MCVRERKWGLGLESYAFFSDCVILSSVYLGKESTGQTRHRVHSRVPESEVRLNCLVVSFL